MGVSDELKPCPFCGSRVLLEKLPLWHGSHGYHGSYEYVAKCRNPHCGASVNLPQNDTVYRDDETARNNAITAWNRRPARNKKAAGSEQTSPLTHKAVRIDNLMYRGCEPHWKCTVCGDCVPFHCYTKGQYEQMKCPGKKKEAPNA